MQLEIRNTDICYQTCGDVNLIIRLCPIDHNVNFNCNLKKNINLINFMDLDLVVKLVPIYVSICNPLTYDIVIVSIMYLLIIIVGIK